MVCDNGILSFIHVVASFGLTERKKERKKEGIKLFASQIGFLKCILADPNIPVKDISRVYSVSSVINTIKKHELI